MGTTSFHVWSRVREFAEQRRVDQQPVTTLERKVRNIITKVSADVIERKSDAGTTNSSQVTRSEVSALWGELHGADPTSILVFTRALVAHAVPDLVEAKNGALRLRNVHAPRVWSHGEIVRAAYFGEMFEPARVIREEEGQYLVHWADGRHSLVPEYEIDERSDQPWILDNVDANHDFDAAGVL